MVTKLERQVAAIVEKSPEHVTPADMVIVREYLDTMAERLGIDPDMLKFLSTPEQQAITTRRVMN